MRKYHYLVLFLVGFVVLLPGMLHKISLEHSAERIVLSGPAEEKEVSVEKPIEELAEQKEIPETEEEKTPEKIPSEEEEKVTETETKKQQETDLPPEEFFRDTLFIGDSRTMGLAEYADLGNAAAFANTGMNVYRLYTLKNALQNQDPYLEDILDKKQYRRIYFMMGVNELGYDFEQTVKRYEEEILKLREKQPEAEIVLEANLHVTMERSRRDEIFNNENIDRMNERIRGIAEKYGFTWLNVNELFDDEEGGLNPEYTHDEVHVLGKYYQQWADWIREKEAGPAPDN